MLRLLVAGLTASVAALPSGMALALGRGLGWLFGSVVRHHRREAIDNIRLSLGLSRREAVRLVQAVYRHQGLSAVEILRHSRSTGPDLPPDVTIEGWAYFEQALAARRGVLILTAHLGSWHALCLPSVRGQRALTIIVKRIRSGWADHAWEQIRAGWNVAFVGARNSYRTCLKALRNEELVGFILDQNMTRDEGVFVDFFGRPACTSPGLAYLSAQSGSPVLPAFAVRTDGGSRCNIRILPPLPPPVDRRPETIREATQTYTRIIEQAVREHPEQWIWQHRRWRTTPPSPEAAEFAADGNAADKAGGKP